MDNPWLTLDPLGSSYILGVDSAEIEGHNERIRDPARTVIVRSIPEPFIGNPASAKVVLLGLNPGHSEDDEETYRGNAEFRNTMFRNLRHESQPYPFYPLNPTFKGTGAGRWWYARTRQLIEESKIGDQAVADKLMVIEWFPYHSRRFTLPRERCWSQEYSFLLATEMLEKGRLVVLMRARKLWTDIDSRFGYVHSLKNPQCGFISRGNTGDWFDRILEALTST
jgi:hypothetical protein